MDCSHYVTRETDDCGIITRSRLNKHIQAVLLAAIYLLSQIHNLSLVFSEIKSWTNNSLMKDMLYFICGDLTVK